VVGARPGQAERTGPLDELGHDPVTAGNFGGRG